MKLVVNPPEPPPEETYSITFTRAEIHKIRAELESMNNTNTSDYYRHPTLWALYDTTLRGPSK